VNLRHQMNLAAQGKKNVSVPPPGYFTGRKYSPRAQCSGCPQSHNLHGIPEIARIQLKNAGWVKEGESYLCPACVAKKAKQ
jgi:hypothetical protein